MIEFIARISSASEASKGTLRTNPDEFDVARLLQKIPLTQLCFWDPPTAESPALTVSVLFSIVLEIRHIKSQELCSLAGIA
jgi:hypothetical protein